MTSWLTTIVRNCALMQLRKRPRQIHLPLHKQTGGEKKYLVWERRADTRPSPEEQCRNLEPSARLQECRRTVVAYSAENISAACPDGALDL
jgi:hypothetical protein